MATTYRADASIRITVLRPGQVSGYDFAFACADRTIFDNIVAMVRSLPEIDRRWLPVQRMWWVSSRGMEMLGLHWPQLASLLEEVEGPIRHQQRTSRARGNGRTAKASSGVPADIVSSFAALYLVPEAPPEIVKAVYRALAKQAHPDAGGSHERMKALNAAFERAQQWASAH